MKSTIRRLVPAKVWGEARKLKRRLEFRKIKEQLPISGRRLVDDLVALGIARGDLLLVHSSLRSLGHVEGGPETVIDALLEAVGPEGTLAFPTFTIDGSMQKTLENEDQLFDPASSPSTVGKISDVFRTRQGVSRSLHPTHSVAALGPLAEQLTRTHLEEGSNFGKGTPFGKLLEFDGKVVGLGINFAPVTPYHAYEDLNLDKFPGVYSDKTFTARIKLPEGTKDVSVRCHDPEFHRQRIDKVPEIEAFFHAHFESEGILRAGPVGSSSSWWMRARDLMESLDRLHKQGITIYHTPNLGQ